MRYAEQKTSWQSRGVKLGLLLLVVFSGFIAGPVSAAEVGGFVGVPISFNGMAEPDCRRCHEDQSIVIEEIIPDRHHLLIGGSIPSDTDAPYASPGEDYQCLSCHSLDFVEDRIAFDFSEFRNCVDCHQQKSGQSNTVHHRTSEAQGGNCTYCHTIPAFGLDRPRQAACRQCHGAFQHDNGGPILDFGACISCHNDSFGMTRAPISTSSSEFPTYGDPPPFHPAPRDSRGNIRGVGYTRPAAGKGIFNLFWAQITDNGEDQEDTFLEDIEPNGEDMDDEGGFRFSRPRIGFTLKQIVNNGRSYNVPRFPDIVPPAPGTGGGSNDSGAGGNLALNKSASASDDEGSSYRPSKAVDGSTSSYWRVDSSRSEWIKVDLGQNYRVDKVVIKWTSEFAREYEVQVSTNNYSWTRVEDQNNGNGGTDEVTFSERDVRYVRVYCTREDDRGYRISELEVYNDSTSTSSSTYSSSNTYSSQPSYYYRESDSD